MVSIPHKIYEFNHGATASVTCRVFKGNPAPSVNWIRDENSVSPIRSNRVFQTQNRNSSTLSFRRVRYV